MSRAAYHRRTMAGGSTSPDTTAFTARLREAVASLALLPRPARDRIAGKIGRLLAGEGADGIWKVLPGFGGEPVLAWGALMDEALKALAAGRVPDAETRLNLLLAGRPRAGEGLARRPEDGLLRRLDMQFPDAGIPKLLDDLNRLHSAMGEGAGS